MAPLQSLKNNRGQALLENVVCLGLFITSTTLALSLGYLLMTQMRLHFEAQEFLFCRNQEGQSFGSCKIQFKEKSKDYLIWGHLKEVRASSLEDIKIIWSLGDFRFKVQRRIHWKSLTRKRVLSP
ncbi:MAG TPA: hypothetical protein DCL41_01580 [Bdellovibrionales bacterium]|nr:hypothetical protein [Pseudobdellovibrionaceae bacterium]HAG90529.1 hypothetical protein [Bdellovibrionales bacterium]|tara:strand:+ start:809 stop:1183 length:375 start_codon:yes stop_codon:yes gene_type:complete